MSTPIDIDAERALWAAVLEEAVRNAQGEGVGLILHEIADARAFLRSRARLEPICDAIGMDVGWVQRELRRQCPTLWGGEGV